MEDQLYKEIIFDHWQNPRNFGVIFGGEINVFKANSNCGDEFQLTGKIKNGCIVAIKFTGTGCALSVACLSLYTQMVKGKSLNEVKKITEKKMLDELGIVLSPARYSCALLGLQLLHAGLLKIKEDTV